MTDIHALRERAKELRCLYAVDAIVSDREHPPARTFLRVLEKIPSGWQRPDSTGASIDYLGRSYVGPGFSSDAQVMSEPILLWGVDVGSLSVSDRDEAALDAAEPFLPEESELLRRIARRLGEYLEWKHTEMLGERRAKDRDHWVWRQRFAEALADNLDPERFGVSRVFLGGSTARGDAGPGSDIDLFVVGNGSEEQRGNLSLWIEGWSLCLAEVALHQTGQPFPRGILNIKWLEEDPGVWQRAELQELRVGGARP